MKKIFKNLLGAIAIIIYFIILSFAYTRMNIVRLTQDIQVFSGAFLVFGLITLEKAYKEDSIKTAITSIELIILSLHSLSIMHVITLFKYDFQVYLITSSFIIVIYYVLKAIVIYTKDRKEYLRGLSDISQIIKEDEPIKKEAKKRKKEKEENIEKKTKETKKEKRPHQKKLEKKNDKTKKVNTTKITNRKVEKSTKNKTSSINAKTENKKSVKTKAETTVKLKKEVKEND